MAGSQTLQSEEAASFWSDARRRLEESNREPDMGEALDFSGNKFPPDPDSKYFHGLVFQTPVSFVGAEFACRDPFDACQFMDEVDLTGCRLIGEDNCFAFTRCRFTNRADFRECQFAGLVEFRGVSFEDDVYFDRQHIVTLRFERDDGTDGSPSCHFEGAAHFNESILSEASFSGAVFERDVSFSGTRFKFWPRFRETEFKSKAVFAGAVFEHLSDEQKQKMSPAEAKRNIADFARALFKYDVDFSNVQFQCDVDFNDATFARDVIFDGADVHGELRFRCHCNGGGDIQLGHLRVRKEHNGEFAYRAAKNSAHARGDSRAEGDYHYREQCAVNARDRQDGRWWCRPWSRDSKVRAWGSYVFGRGVYGYGERPQRVVYVGLGVIALWAVAYWLLEAAKDGASSFLTYLYFSVVTFTTLGYGDLQPKAGFSRFFAGTEALFGAALMALFVVALTRRYTR